MEIIKTFNIQRRTTPGSGEWTEVGLVFEKPEWAKPILKNFSDAWPEHEFRIVGKMVVTICKPVNL